ncbi:MAG: hypothetical protein BWY00_01801 [Firmicutes bacterium ADurb.Bin153]|nr:MAG: hypothetical protein BWY00_01801 [Firmicutes bacterium ADurb.Bin153]
MKSEIVTLSGSVSVTRDGSRPIAVRASGRVSPPSMTALQ